MKGGDCGQSPVDKGVEGIQDSGTRLAGPVGPERSLGFSLSQNGGWIG